MSFTSMTDAGAADLFFAGASSGLLQEVVRNKKVIMTIRLHMSGSIARFDSTRGLLQNTAPGIFKVMEVFVMSSKSMDRRVFSKVVAGTFLTGSVVEAAVQESRQSGRLSD